MKLLALDTNLMVFFCIASADEKHIGEHKRISNYTSSDFEYLKDAVGQVDGLVSTPYAMAEVSNLLNISEKRRIDFKILAQFRGLVECSFELPVSSRHCIELSEFATLGLTDVAWLEYLDDNTVLLSTDEPLISYARSMGKMAELFCPSNQ